MSFVLITVDTSIYELERPLPKRKKVASYQINEK